MAHTSWGEPHHACKEIRRGRQQGCTSQIAAASWLVKSQPLTYTCVARSSWLGWVFNGGVPSRERGTSLLLVADLEKALPTPKTSDTLLPAPPAADKRNYSARVLGSGWLTEGSPALGPLAAASQNGKCLPELGGDVLVLTEIHFGRNFSSEKLVGSGGGRRHFVEIFNQHCYTRHEKSIVK